MLINPYKDRPAVIPGTRLLETTLGIVGTKIPDPHNPFRVWEIQALYAPVTGRAIGGVRTKLVDQKNFVTFCNQKDLEVLLGIGAPGAYCYWAESTYAGPHDEEWCGLCCDDNDLIDDLFEREMFIRAQLPGSFIPPTYDIQRYVHLERNADVEDVFVLLGDVDHDTGIFPDPRIETIERRWMRSERKRVRWERC